MKKKIKIILGIVILTIIVLFILLAISKPSKPTQRVPLSPTPTAIPIPSEMRQTSTTPVIKYNQESEQKIIERIDNKPSLSKEDIQSKNTVRNSLANKSGSPIITDLFRVNYLYKNDIFLIEITTTDIDLAKKEAVDWFLSQGFTKNGLCNLPVNFYLSWEVKQEIENSGKSITFNSLPDFCK